MGLSQTKLEAVMQNESLTQWYRKIADVVDNIGQATTEFEKLNPKPEGGFLNNPFDCVYDFEGDVEKLKNSLVGYVVGRTQKSLCPNLKLDDGRIAEFVKQNGFDAQAIEDFIRTEFLPSADNETVNQLLTQAKNLLPWVDNDGADLEGVHHKANKPADILSGKKVRLHAYLTSEYSFNREKVRTYDGSALELRALEKIIEIKLEGVGAQRAGSPVFNHLFGAYGEDAQRFFRLHKLNQDVIERVRAFKNNNLDIQFKTEEQAQIIAELLTS